jgi:hypothetical protein
MLRMKLSEVGHRTPRLRRFVQSPFTDLHIRRFGVKAAKALRALAAIRA